MTPKTNLTPTSKSCESPSHCNGCSSYDNGESAKQQIKLSLRELGAKIVHKRMYLTKAKHTKRLHTHIYYVTSN